MIDRQRHRHDRADLDRPVPGDRRVDGGADRENRRLRRVQDGHELLDPEHAEVRDRERAVLEVRALELAVSGPADDVRPRGRDFYKRLLGFDETFVDWDDKWSKLENGRMRIAVAEGDPTMGGGVAAVDVEDIKAAAQRLRDEGVEVGTVLELAGQMRIVDVFDPDGNRVQLTEEVD